MPTNLALCIIQRDNGLFIYELLQRLMERRRCFHICQLYFSLLIYIQEMVEDTRVSFFSSLEENCGDNLK
jgi:hypothetical protein